MGAQTVISPALKPWEADLLASAGVSLAKAGDPLHLGGMIMVMDGGAVDGYTETVSPVKINMVKVTGGWDDDGACHWCCGDELVPALYRSVSGTGWVERMCRHHAMRWARFIPAHALRHVAGWVDSDCATYVEDYGFRESV